jgi:Uma2 family endonuclease
LATFVGGLLNAFVRPRNLGVVTGASGAREVMPDRIRVPEVAFTSWDRMPGRRRPAERIPRLVPDLAIEVLRRSNTPGEMAAKRHDYFTAGVVRVWEVNPETRTVAVFTAPDTFVTLGAGDVLVGEPVLPGFALPVADLFAELDRQG